MFNKIEFTEVSNNVLYFKISTSIVPFLFESTLKISANEVITTNSADLFTSF